MKNVTILFCWIFSSCFSYCQIRNCSLIGVWQADQSEVTSMYLDTYKFTQSGAFSFKPNEYNGLNRIIEIKGKFFIKVDTLVFEPQFTKEMTGGYFIRSETTTLSDTWEIIGAKVKIFKCKKTKQVAILKKFQDCDSIFIDGRVFYKIK